MLIPFLVGAALSLFLLPSATQALSIGSILKTGGIGFAVDRMAEPLNNFINSLLAKQNAGTEYATKVVPIVSVGSTSHVGAAQVTGPSDLVEKTKAVLQVEGDFSGFRVKAVVPIDSQNPAKFSRVQGIGVSAIIDINI